MEVTKQGRIPLEVLEASPPSRLVVQIADPKLPFGGTWSYQIAPAPQGTRLTITENGEIDPVLMRFMARFVYGYKRTMERYLRSLGRKLGEDVRFEV